MANARGKLPDTSRGGDRLGSDWKRAVQGRTAWVSPDPSPEEVEDLLSWYPEIVEPPEEEVRAETEEWAASAIVARSLGRRVGVESAIRDFRLRGGINGEVTGYSLEQGFLFFRFKDAGERDIILRRPWVVAGQTLAMEPWRPGFFPDEGAIRTALVWIRLPRLPVELWGEAALRKLLSLAGELVSVDECTAQRRRLGFARVCVRINLARPLRPGVRVRGPEDSIFWQRFLYEGVDGLCFHCGCIHLSEDICTAGKDEVSSLYRAGDGGLGGGHAGDGGLNPDARRGPRWGPWMVVSRLWLPAVTGKTAATGEGRGGNPRAWANGPELSMGRPGFHPARSGSGQADRATGNGDWVKPTKIARRRSPVRVVHDPSTTSKGEGTEIGALTPGLPMTATPSANRFEAISEGYDGGIRVVAHPATTVGGGQKG